MAEVAGFKIRKLKFEIRKTTRPAIGPAPPAGNQDSGIENRKSPRTVLIANRHPRLHLDRRAVKTLIAVLDTGFHAVPDRSAGRTSNADAGTPAPPSAIRDPRSSVRSACPPGDLSLVFLTDAAQARLHADFLADPTPTDVITFEGDAAHGTAGEICVSADTAATYARAHRRDFSAELTLYVIHGWLHLAGYDDLQPAKRRAMRRAEARAVKLLQSAGVRPRFSLRH